MFSSLKIKDFRIYWFGMFVSLVGTWVQLVAQSWLVFQLTRSAFLLGVVGFLSSIPVLLFSLFGGVLADRANKRVILIFTQIAFMLLAFLLAILTQTKLITARDIMLIALLDGFVMAFDAPSRQAVVVELVGKEHLFNAIALNSVAFNSSRVIGPALAGLLVAAIGMSGCFYLNAASFLALIAALFFIKGHGNHRPAKSGAALNDLKEGLIFIRGNRVILGLMAVVATVSLFGISYVILMPIFASDILKVGVRGMGVLMSLSGIGAVCGALTLARLGDFKRKGKLLMFSSLLFSLSLIVFSLSRTYMLSLASLAFVGFSSVIAISITNTILQINVEDAFRGRVMGVFMLTFAGMMPFGNLLSGALAHKFGVSAAVFTGGVICLIFFTAVNIIYPQIRDL
jgi:MFS family permease